MVRWLVVAVGFCIAASPVLAADPIEIGIGYLGRAGKFIEPSADSTAIRTGSTSSAPHATASPLR